MMRETDSHLSDAPVVPSRQLPLFPLDPWGGDQVVALLEQPFPGIARAMIGPLVLGDDSDQMNTPLQCLTVTQDGHFAASIGITQAQLNAPDALWNHVLQKLDLAQQQRISSANVRWSATPEDCPKRWSDPSFWIPRPVQGDPIHGSVRALSKLLTVHKHEPELGLQRMDHLRTEAQAQAMVAAQISAGVLHVLDALEPELSAVLIQRPRLSVLLAHQLICMAKLHSPSAVTYVLQALRTESLGVLHLISSGQPENDANQVREAIFNGRSLPDAFVNLGIAKAAHRYTVCRSARREERPAEPVLSLSDLPISGRDWLVAMRLIKHLPLQGKEDWAEFSRLVQQLMELNLQQDKTGVLLLQWCIRNGYRNCCYQLDRVMTQARALIFAAWGMASLDATIDDAVSMALSLVQSTTDEAGFAVDFDGLLDPDNLFQLVMGVSHISGKSISQLMQVIFDVHPGIPAGFPTPGRFTIQVLDGLSLASAHGIECGNCLESPSTIVDYVTEGVALYGVRTVHGIAGTIALRYDSSEDHPTVQVQEVSGVKNAVARFDLCQLAQSLADACSTAQQVGAWAIYEDRCVQWRRSASPHTSQSSQ